MPTALSRSPVTALIIGMLPQLDTGYYAVQRDPEHPHIDFVRVSRPTYGKWSGAVKVQTQHSEELIERWAYFPPKDGQPDRVVILSREIEDIILRLLANKRAAMRLYADKIEKCCRCNKKLTDERSRYYGFGPECEESLEGMKDEIDDEMGGSYEELLARGELV
jgi:hypothetical protein